MSIVILHDHLAIYLSGVAATWCRCLLLYYMNTWPSTCQMELQHDVGVYCYITWSPGHLPVRWNCNMMWVSIVILHDHLAIYLSDGTATWCRCLLLYYMNTCPTICQMFQYSCHLLGSHSFPHPVSGLCTVWHQRQQQSNSILLCLFLLRGVSQSSAVQVTLDSMNIILSLK